jgi:hypothetical protein
MTMLLFLKKIDASLRSAFRKEGARQTEERNRKEDKDEES